MFQLSGPKSKVDEVEALIQDHTARWPRIGNDLYHYTALWWGVFPVLSCAAVMTLLFGAYGKSPLSLAIGAGLAYCSAVVFVILVRAPSWNPFIWFYRPGSSIERKKVWLPRLTAGVVLVILGEIVGNYVWKMMGG